MIGEIATPPSKADSGVIVSGFMLTHGGPPPVMAAGNIALNQQEL